jgi:hypothetical protein
MLSTAAPDFRPGSSLFGPVERKSVTLVSGRLGGVRCGLSGPAPVQARRIGPGVHLWPIGAASGRPVDVHPSSDDMPVAAANHDRLAVVGTAAARQDSNLRGAPNLALYEPKRAGRRAYVRCDRGTRQGSAAWLPTVGRGSSRRLAHPVSAWLRRGGIRVRGSWEQVGPVSCRQPRTPCMGWQRTQPSRVLLAESGAVSAQCGQRSSA